VSRIPPHGQDAARIVSPTEERNPRTLDIDQLPTLEMLRKINDEDVAVAPAVRMVLPALAIAVDHAVEALREGHCVHYFGAGTSGRIAVLDAAELLPTFSLEAGRFVAHLAGGDQAFTKPVENAEDSVADGEHDAGSVRPGDVVVALTASGRTPYALGALRAGRARGAYTVLISANPDAELAGEADLHLGVDTGPEVIAGSTRMKAGTAEKLVLNAFSTAVMIRLGKTYSNLMVHLLATNAKLRGRLVGLLEQATNQPSQTCEDALAAAGGDAKVALVSLLGQVDVSGAQEALSASDGVVRAALAKLEATA
jgi:N-acetylmuramic acid 6-phosphate etherase